MTMTIHAEPIAIPATDIDRAIYKAHIEVAIATWRTNERMIAVIDDMETDGTFALSVSKYDGPGTMYSQPGVEGRIWIEDQSNRPVVRWATGADAESGTAAQSDRAPSAPVLAWEL